MKHAESLLQNPKRTPRRRAGGVDIDMLSNIATNVVAFVLVLGFLVFAHEAGHFIMAKLFGVRVLVFSFGFGKRLFGFNKGATDYRVSAIPLGGYVRMAGDVPEEERKGDPDEFLSRPKWQRFLILFAGPAINIVIAIVFLAWLNMAGTETLRESRPVIGAVMPGKPAAEAGLRAGDRIIEVSGEQTKTWDDLRLAISMSPGSPVSLTYVRDEKVMKTILTPLEQETDYGVSGFAGLQKYIGTEVGRVDPKSGAAKAGIRNGDQIVAIDGQPISQLPELDDWIQKTKGAPMILTVARGSSKLNTRFVPGKRGNELDRGFIPPTEIRRMSLIPAFRESIGQNLKMARYAFAVISRLLRFQGSVKEFQGPISIARISGEMLRTGWKAVIYLMASISLQLGILNLLPIPVLDGGHIAILGVEGAARRDLSLAMKERIQQIGFAMIATLMIVVLFNDVIQNVLLLRKG
jgi:regulator of sigma E protease